MPAACAPIDCAPVTQTQSSMCAIVDQDAGRRVESEKYSAVRRCAGTPAVAGCALNAGIPPMCAPIGNGGTADDAPCMEQPVPSKATPPMVMQVRRACGTCGMSLPLYFVVR